MCSVCATMLDQTLNSNIVLFCFLQKLTLGDPTKLRFYLILNTESF